MSTNRDIVRRALRKLGALAAGSNPPDGEAQDALETLQSLYLSLAASGALGAIVNVIATADATAPENTRVRADPDVIVTVPLTIGETTALPSPYPLDWDIQWCLGAGWGPRTPKDNAVVADAVGNYFLYKADLGKWIACSNITLNGEFPFSEALANGFGSWLAVTLAPEYGQPTTLSMEIDARNLRFAITHNYASQALGRGCYEG